MMLQLLLPAAEPPTELLLLLLAPPLPLPLPPPQQSQLLQSRQQLPGGPAGEHHDCAAHNTAACGRHIMWDISATQ